MDYRKYGKTIYARFDKGEEILSGILSICRQEGINSAIYSGIGGCGEVVVSTYIPEKKEFLPHKKTGMLEMISLQGNIISDDEGKIYEHTHALFSYLDDNKNMQMIGGHLTSAVVLYTGEITIQPVENGIIKRRINNDGIPVWDLSYKG